MAASSLLSDVLIFNNLLYKEGSFIDIVYAYLSSMQTNRHFINLYNVKNNNLLRLAISLIIRSILLTNAVFYILYKELALITYISASSTSITRTNDTMSPSVAACAPNDLAKQMQHASMQASQLLKSLSHPDRLLLLCQLTQGEYCVSELENLVGVAQPSLSQQLGILRKDELVKTRREGKQIYYSIASDDAIAVLQLLYDRFCAKANG